MAAWHGLVSTKYIYARSLQLFASKPFANQICYFLNTLLIGVLQEACAYTILAINELRGQEPNREAKQSWPKWSSTSCSWLSSPSCCYGAWVADAAAMASTVSLHRRPGCPSSGTSTYWAPTKDENGTEISRTEPHRFFIFNPIEFAFSCPTLPFSLSHFRCFVFQM